jgi:signal transduction histidine kinase
MVKIPFKVSARTAKLIGLENFSNEEGAIIELVKNTYDADAKNCVLIFDLKYKRIIKEGEKEKEREVFDIQNSKIYVIDNGSGMTKDVITNQWMTIGTDDKLYKHLTDNGRIKTGAKGIGRFALNRLGTATNLVTVSIDKKTNQKKGINWNVNWNDFDKSGTTVSEVKAEIQENDSLSIKEIIQSKFNRFDNIISSLKETSFETGTIIEISNLNDIWEESQLDNLFGNLEMLLPPKELSDFHIHFFSTSHPDKYGKVKTAYYDDFDYKVEAKYLDDNDKNVKITITRNELDIEALEDKYKEVFDFKTMKDFPFRLDDLKAKTFTITKSVNELFSKELDVKAIDKIGKFIFTFYFLKNTISDDKKDGDLKKYPYRGFNSANRKSWLKRFGGVKIFRDDFRIRPYGENGDDWLKLGERQAQSPGGAGQKMGGYRIRPNQIAGTINISRVYNASFQDKSGREGIQENNAFELFKNILIELISAFEKDRNTIMFNLSELHKKRNKEAEDKRKAIEEAERIRKEKEERENNNSDESKSRTDEETEEDSTEETLAKGVQILKEEVEEKDEEIRILRNLASVGLIISSFAHELKSLRSRLIPRTTFLLKELKNHLNQKELEKSLDKDDNPFYMIKLIQEEDTKFKHWLDYSLNTLKKDKRERRNLDFNKYFETFKSTWKKALEQRNIDLKISNIGSSPCVIRAFEVDMDSIFNNLLSNSLNALKGSKQKSKVIAIEWKKNNDDIEIIFTDNGKGLDIKYKDKPEEIFNLFETSKTDRHGNKIGTGLGLYIVKTIIQEYNNSTISVKPKDVGVLFIIKFKARQ